MPETIYLPSPIGTLKAVYSSRGLSSLRLLPCSSDTLPAPADSLDEQGKEIANAVSAYFSGDRKSLDAIAIDLSSCTAFQQAVYEQLRKVPWGKVLSYGELARIIGKPSAARATGSAVGHNPLLLVVPCHRVVGSDGLMHGFSAEGGLATKEKLLRHEGVRIEAGRVVDFAGTLTEQKQRAHQSAGFHSGYVALVGKPNAGKSSLLNRVLGQPIAGVSVKPQTTRKRQLGVLTNDDGQIIFLDTPGFHDPIDSLSEFINSEASFALADADLLAFLVDSTSTAEEYDRQVLDALQKKPRDKVLLVLTKTDLASEQKIEIVEKACKALLPGIQALRTSAHSGAGIRELISTLLKLLPEGPMYYPEDQITDDFERDIAAEMIRASAMEKLQDELPYCLAVKVEEYNERQNGDLYILATIFVERETQKGILIGKKGQKIKEIGVSARRSVEEMTGQKVFLSLQVKVQKDWKNDSKFLQELGMAMQK